MRRQPTAGYNLIPTVAVAAIIATAYIALVTMRTIILASATPTPVVSPTAGPGPLPEPLATTPSPLSYSRHFPGIPLYPGARLAYYLEASENQGPREAYRINDGSTTDNALGFYRVEMPKAGFKLSSVISNTDVYSKAGNLYEVTAAEQKDAVYLYITLEPGK
jgi:hypothetical protein